MVSELQRQLEELDKISTSSSDTDRSLPPIPPRRQNPFNSKLSSKSDGISLSRSIEEFFSFPGNETVPNNQQVEIDDLVVLRHAPPPPRPVKPIIPHDNARFDEMFEAPKEPESFTFEMIHEELGRPILQAMFERRALKESAERPLIQF